MKDFDRRNSSSLASILIHLDHIQLTVSRLGRS